MATLKGLHYIDSFWMTTGPCSASHMVSVTTTCAICVASVGVFWDFRPYRFTAFLAVDVNSFFVHDVNGLTLFSPLRVC